MLEDPLAAATHDYQQQLCKLAVTWMYNHETKRHCIYILLLQANLLFLATGTFCCHYQIRSVCSKFDEKFENASIWLFIRQSSKNHKNVLDVMSQKLSSCWHADRNGKKRCSRSCDNCWGPILCCTTLCHQSRWNSGSAPSWVRNSLLCNNSTAFELSAKRKCSSTPRKCVKMWCSSVNRLKKDEIDITCPFLCRERDIAIVPMAVPNCSAPP